MKHWDVVGLGVSTLDALYLVEAFPADEGNRRALDFSLQGGGPVATAIVALARLGARVAMADTAGDDWRGLRIRQEFESEGVATDMIEVHTGATSTLACVLVRQQDGARSIVWYPGSAPDLVPLESLRRSVEASRCLHLNGRHLEACQAACRWAKRAGRLISFDGGAGRYREELRSLLPLSDICIVALEFAQTYAGLQHPAQAARRLLDEGPSLVVLTDGERGSWVHSRGETPFHQPAFAMPHVTDTTGCGDAFHGAFLFGLLESWPLPSVARFASAAAALNTRQLGGRQGLPTRAEVEALLTERARDPA
jgi:sulfofructose kinase